jgi:hypothetical protein
MQRFPSLGTDCVKIQESVDESKGNFVAFFALMLFSFVGFFLLALYCITFLLAVETPPTTLVGNICNEIQVYSHMHRL